jgi:hypothetical protein
LATTRIVQIDIGVTLQLPRCIPGGLAVSGEENSAQGYNLPHAEWADTVGRFLVMRFLLLLLATPASASDLTWTVGPSLPTTDSSAYATRTVSVEIMGKAIKLSKTFGELRPEDQSTCTKKVLKHDEVARLTFYELGVGGWVLKRDGDEIKIYSWSVSDGACQDKHHNVVACPVNEKLVTSVKVPGDEKLRERVFELDAKGKRNAFVCDNKD